MRLLEASSGEDAVEALHEAGLTDGLPVIVPTPERVERMILASGHPGDQVLGVVGGSDRLATVEAVAANAVMAGCLPDHMPVVVAAVRAICDPEFDLGQVQPATHNFAPLIIVNGPARWSCGPFSSGWGALGPGHRANASVGRAVRLVMITIGGARPGVTDMAVLGSPAKFSYCLAEAEEASTLPPLHVSRGWGVDDSTVTVIAAEAPHSVLMNVGTGDESGPERLLTILSATAAALGSNNVWKMSGATVVVLNPSHAEVLTAAGLDRVAIQSEILRRARHPRSLLASLDAAGEGIEDIPGREDELLPNRELDDIVVLVAGGEGGYSAVMPTWGAASHGNRAVTCRIELDQACAVPAMTRP